MGLLSFLKFAFITTNLHILAQSDDKCGYTSSSAAVAEEYLNSINLDNNHLLIDNGTEVYGATKYPWMASLLIECPQYECPMGCSASILSESFILTAGHCGTNGMSQKVNESAVNVYVGSTTTRTGKNHSVKTVTVHEKYNDQNPNSTYDIAILELEEPLEFGDKVRAICLAQNVAQLMNETVVAVGWGQIAQGQRTNKLHEGEEHFVEANECVQEKTNSQMDENFQLCTKGQVARHGDSGGPLMAKSGDRWIQLGVASQLLRDDDGIEDNESNVYTKVAVFCAWIAEATDMKVKCLDL